jgi:hypothetical protein
MGNFPFMSFDGSVCFLVMYHYKANAIMTTPITGLDDVCIFNAYKLNFNNLKHKGYKRTLNIMDNPAMKYIMSYKRGMQITVGQAAQSLGQRSQTGDPDIQGCLHFSPCNYLLQLPIATLGQAYSPSDEHVEHVVHVLYQSHKIRV